MKRGLGIAVAAIASAIGLGAGLSRASTPPSIVFAADRAPMVSDEIYRLDPNGRRVDLSRSPYRDTNPVVSSDGRRVAFISDRRGTTGLYEVGVNGRGLVVVARNGRVPKLGARTALAWQPHGRRLAVDFPSTVAVVRPRRKSIYVRGQSFGSGQQPWSPDGRVLLVWTGSELRAVTPLGHALWSVPARLPSGSWSSQGLLAVTTPHGAAVYDADGHLRSRLRFGPALPDSGPFWSPDGRKLVLFRSSASGFDLQVSTTDGQFLLRKHVRDGYPTWAGNDRLVLAYGGRCGCHPEYVNVHTGRLSPGSLRWFHPLSADRKLAILTPRSGASFSIAVGSTRGGAAKRYAHVPGCWIEEGVLWPALDSSQFAGRTRSIVYASRCNEPFSYLYSIAPDGTKLHEIAAVKPYATEPVLSPDGSQIAYSWSRFQSGGPSCERFGGCASEIRVAKIDGTGARVLANPGIDCIFDRSPAWSPDGQTILFSESSNHSSKECDTGGFFTVPVTGGQAHALGFGGGSPAWGPSRIAYEAGGLWTANPDGSDPVQVAKKGSRPAWASDGRLAYIVKPATVVVGSTHVKLPFTSVSSLAWSPDGSRFIVTAWRAKTVAPDVYTVHTDGTDPIRLTKNFDAQGVSWR